MKLLIIQKMNLCVNVRRHSLNNKEKSFALALKVSGDICWSTLPIQSFS